VRIKDVVRGQSFTLQIASDQSLPFDIPGASPGKLVRRLSQDFPGLRRGADISFASDLPSLAGMGSSSALMIAIFHALSTVNRIAEADDYSTNIRTHEELASYLNCVENGERYRLLAGGTGVVTSRGGQDQAAMLLSRPRQAIQVVSSPVRLEEAVMLPSNCVFAVAATGVRAEESGSERTSRAEREFNSILSVWRSVSGTNPRSLSEALSSTPDATDRIRLALKDTLDGSDSQSWLKRFEQFHLESEVIIPQATAALAGGNLARFGELVDESQAAAERWLENQRPEATWLVQQARSVGAYAAFASDAGASVWALVERNDAEDFLKRWRKSHAGFSQAGTSLTQFFVTEAGPAVVHF
jgi:galactokinase